MDYNLFKNSNLDIFTNRLMLQSLNYVSNSALTNFFKIKQNKQKLASATSAIPQEM